MVTAVRLLLNLDRLAELEKARKKSSGPADPSQLGLFAPRQPPPEPRPAPALHPEQRLVGPHMRHTPHGEVPVAAHIRTVHVAHHPEPPPRPEPEPEPEPHPTWPSNEELLGPGAQPMPAAPSAPPPAPPPEPEPEPPAPVPQPSPPPPPAPPEEPSPAAPAPSDNQPAKLDEYLYRHEGPLVWMPDGAERLDDHTIRTPEPLHQMDLELLGLEPQERNGDGYLLRALDPYERGTWSEWVEDEEDPDHSGYEEHDTSGAAPRTLWAPLLERWEEFQNGFEKLKKRAERLGLTPPSMTVLGTTTRTVPVGVEGWGQDSRTVYGKLPAQLVKIENPAFSIKGWTVEAVVKPLSGTKATIITKVGKAGDMPDRLRHTGMHCDHCGTDRDRSFVVALRNDKSGNWKQVGGSCLADFTGKSASNLASSTSFLANWWKQGDDEGMGESEHIPRGKLYHDPDHVLAAALYVVEQTGEYVSKSKAEEQMVMSTSHEVGELLAKGGKAREILTPDRLKKVAQIRAWLRSLPAHSGDSYMDNLAALGQADAVGGNHLGLLVSAVAGFERMQRVKAEEERRAKAPADAGHFGKPGDKIGRKASKADREAGVTEHPAQRVKVTRIHNYTQSVFRAGRHSLESRSIVEAENADGHRFVWHTSGGPTHANLVDNVPNELQQIAPGETFDMVATVHPDPDKAHSEFKGRKQTQIQRAEFHRVHTAEERAAKEQAEQQERERQGDPNADNWDTREAGLRAARAVAEARMSDPPDRTAGAASAPSKAETTLKVSPELADFWQAVEVDTHDGSPGPRQALVDALGRAKRTKAGVTLKLTPELVQYLHSEHGPIHYQREAVSDQLTGGGGDAAELKKLDREFGKLAKQFPQGGSHLKKAVPSPGGKLTKPKPPSNPAAGAPLPSPAPGAGAVPPTPGQRVKFRHPAHGGEEEGHVHAQGAHGATIVDGHGAVHKVPHGHYMHADSPTGGEGDQKPSAELVRAAARKHLELGVDKPLGVHAAAALLVTGGVRSPHVHEFTASDVKFSGDYALFPASEMQTNEKPLVEALRQLAERNKQGPLFALPGSPMTADSLTTYVRRFGVGPVGGHPGSSTPAAPGAAAPPPAGMPMAKATPGALDLPSQPGSPLHSWVQDGYRVSWRKSAQGVGLASIDGPGMRMPLHEVCASAARAKSFADEAIPALKKGVAPRRGLFQRVAP